MLNETQASPVMMSVNEVAARWGVAIRTIYAAIERGEIKVLRVGKTIRISRSHVEFLESSAGAVGNVRKVG